jgi:hypothetical protein
LYHSRLRQDPDLDLEASIDIALARIENAAPPLDEYPVKRIWQTARNNAERPEESRLWEEGHPDWEYEVSLRYCRPRKILQPLMVSSHSS